MKKYLLGSLFAFSLTVSGVSYADFLCRGMIMTPDASENPVTMTDSVRAAVGNLMTILGVGREPETGAVLNVTQEEVGTLEDGDESYRVDEGTGSASGGDLAISAYAYMKDHVFTDAKRTPYTPLNKKLKKGADMKQVVKDMFFIQNEADNTDEKQREVLENRMRYLTVVGREYTKLAYNIQQKLIDDMGAISADINGNGSIGAVAGMDQTWKAVNKALIADIGLQIQLMELEAARFLSVQPVMIMTEERPEASHQGSEKGGNS